jgi:HlyD family secretion protein
MNMPSESIDLSALARPAVSPAAPPRRRRIGPWIVLLLLLAFGALIAWSLADTLRGEVEVSVVRPRLASSADATSSAPARAPLLQAAGWVEPDPFPTQVSARVSGVLAQVLVRESERVEADQLIATLVDDLFQIDCDQAEATLVTARAELAEARAEQGAASANWTHALAVKEAVAKATAEERARRAEKEMRAAAVEEARAGERIARSELELQRDLTAAASTGARQLELAVARVDQAVAAVALMQAEAALADARHAGSVAELERAEAESRLRIEDQARRDTSLARVSAAEGRVAEVEQMCARAKLRLAWTEIRAPTAGVVLERLVMPGTPLDAGEAGVPVVTLFDPTRLRVRVDVAQGEVGKLVVGQRVELASEARAGRPYRGELLRVVQKADIQKTTLQAHVRVLDPDELLRPEMLCQARFFALAAPGGPADAGSPADSALAPLEIPRRLLDEQGRVWVVAGDGTAARRKLDASGDGEWVRVTSGLNRSDKLVDEGRAALTEGARLRVTKED